MFPDQKGDCATISINSDNTHFFPQLLNRKEKEIQVPNLMEKKKAKHNRCSFDGTLLNINYLCFLFKFSGYYCPLWCMVTMVIEVTFEKTDMEWLR